MKIIFLAAAGLALRAEQLFFAEAHSSGPVSFSLSETTLSASMQGRISCQVPTCGYGFDFFLDPNPIGPTVAGYDVAMTQSITGYLLWSEFENSVFRGSDGAWLISGGQPLSDGSSFETRNNSASFQIRFPDNTPKLNRWIQVFVTGANGATFDFDAHLSVVAIPANLAGIPEPSTISLWGLGAAAIAGTAGYRWKTRRGHSTIGGS